MAEKNRHSERAIEIKSDLTYDITCLCLPEILLICSDATALSVTVVSVYEGMFARRTRHKPGLQINAPAIHPNTLPPKHHSLLQPRLPNICRLRGPGVGGMATSPLPSRGSSTWGQKKGDNWGKAGENFARRGLTHSPWPFKEIRDSACGICGSCMTCAPRMMLHPCHGRLPCHTWGASDVMGESALQTAPSQERRRAKRRRHPLCTGVHRSHSHRKMPPPPPAVDDHHPQATAKPAGVAPRGGGDCSGGTWVSCGAVLTATP